MSFYAKKLFQEMTGQQLAVNYGESCLLTHNFCHSENSSRNQV